MSAPARTLGESFRTNVAAGRERPLLYSKSGGRYEAQTWGEVAAKVDAMANWLASQGLESGERVAILSENRPEWLVLDMACQTLGLATVPIYNSLTSDEIRYLLEDSSARIIGVSSRPLLEKLGPIQRKLPKLKAVIAFDPSLSVYADLFSVPLVVGADIDRCAGELSPPARQMAARVSPSTLASVLYTSGTTGVPKGVMLTHDNFLSNCEYCRNALAMGPSDKHLSFLPLSHIFERTAGYYLMIAIGAQIAYAETMDTVPQNIVETRPTFLLGVPRFYEKIRERVVSAVEQASSLRKGMFYWALDLGRKTRLGTGHGALFALERALAEILVYRKFRARLGGKLRFGVSGGAPLPRDLAEFFHDLGVLILEGYGLSETSPVIACNREDRHRFGTVGIPLAEIEVSISPEGEILTRGRSVMQGYLNKPEETRAALDPQGWFHTGDLGSIDKDGFLSITGRKKELIVTSGGKKVAPRAIEEKLEKDPLILRAVLNGEGKKFITALVVPRADALTQLARAEKIAFERYADLLSNPVVYERVAARIDELTQDLASYEKIKYFILLENDFTQASGELTPTLKVKREVVLSRHRQELDALYSRPYVG